MIKLLNILLESTNWYHGTPDSREVEKLGGFDNKLMSAEYIVDLDRYQVLKVQMRDALSSSNSKLYTVLERELNNITKKFTYKKPIFLSDEFKVAKTYADSKRSFDYQNSIEKVFKVETYCSKIVRIVAPGEAFRFLNVEKVKNSFIDAGVSEQVIEDTIKMFTFSSNESKGIQTDLIAAIGSWLDFDCIDVVGVLDSYQGGKDKSTVRMVLDSSKIKIIK